MAGLRENIKKHSLNVLGIAFSMALLIFSIWQLDLICVNPVWGSVQGNIAFYQGLEAMGVGAYSQLRFQCFLLETTIGMAYDLFLFFIFSAFFVLFISLWFWED